MTDRAKKISELQATTSVANTDKLVVLKDAANSSIASTRYMTMTNFANSVKGLIAPQVPNSVYVSNTFTVVSNGTSYVNAFSFSVTDYDGMDVTFHANEGNNVTIGKVVVVANTSDANAQYLVTAVGPNHIIMDAAPVINTTSNLVFIQLRRNSATSANVSVRYSATLM